MKKRIVLLPLLMLVLAACGPTTTDTSSDEPSSGTDTPTDSSTPTDTSSPTDTSTSTEVPPDEKSIGDIITEATVGKIYKTTGTVTHLNGGSIFIQDDDGDAINAYPGSTATASLVVGNVVEVTGSYKTYNLAPELDAASVTLVSATDPTPIVPEVIDTDVALTAAMGTDYTVSGKFVRLNGVTTGAWASNKSTLTLGTATVGAYAGFSAGHEALGENRTEIGTLMAALATSGDAFDIMGVLYSSNATGVWNLGFPTVNYIVAEEPEPQLVNPIVLTGAKLGLGAAYVDVASVAVDNVDMGVYQCSDYGDGIQMRYKDSKQSSFFNIEAAPYPIVSIEILHTAAKYPTYAPTLLDIYAGTESQQAATTGAQQPVTEVSVFSYEVTFEASQNITFFKIEKPALSYTAYLESVTITMEVPVE